MKYQQNRNRIFGSFGWIQKNLIVFRYHLQVRVIAKAQKKDIFWLLLKEQKYIE